MFVICCKKGESARGDSTLGRCYLHQSDLRQREEYSSQLNGTDLSTISTDTGPAWRRRCDLAELNFPDRSKF